MANLVVPEVFRSIESAKFKEKVKLLNLAENIGEIEEFRQVGETIHFPRFKALDISKMKEMQKGDVLDVSELEQEDSTATIKQVGFATRVYDIADLTAFGSQVDESAKQHATIFARKLDEDIAIEAQTSLLKAKTASATEITNAELGNAMALFEDEIDAEEFAGIVINSRLVNSFYDMPEFVDVSKTYVGANNGVVRGGLLGTWRGIPVFVANHGTYDGTECITYIIKKGALGYKMKRDINIEIERLPKAKATDIVSDMIYAVKLLNDEGVVVLRNTIV